MLLLLKESQENNETDGLSSVSVLQDALVWLVRLWFDGHSTSRCYLCGPWGQRSFFASLDLFTTETRQLRFCGWTRLAHRPDVFPLTDSSCGESGIYVLDMVGFYGSSGDGLKVCVWAEDYAALLTE